VSLKADPIILCFDDDHFILSLYYARLCIDGFRCVPCETYGAAIAMAIAMPVALAVLDCDRPGMSGVEIARQLRMIQPDIALVLNTGNSSTPENEVSVLHAIRDKGVSFVSLSESINRWLSRGQASELER
jgi:DNA-binding response OmpR family regulator